MAASSDARGARGIRLVVFAVIAIAVGWAFPLFHVVPLEPTPAPGRASSPGAVGSGPVEADTNASFDPAARAASIWHAKLIPAVARAAELSVVLPALRENPEAAKTKFAKSAGVGAHYYFVRGRGKIVARERSYLRVAVEGAEGHIVALRIGPIFGNTVRDGTGLLDVNAFPGLQEFNALSAELNARVEKKIQPALREKGIAGATVEFAGCAEAPESAADAGEPALTIVPIQAEVR